MTDYMYALLKSGEITTLHGNGLTKRDCCYTIFLYQKLGMDIPATFALASNGLRSTQVCKWLDDALNEGYFRSGDDGHYYLTSEGMTALESAIYTESEWDILKEFQHWLSKATLEEKHFQAVIYLVLTDSGIGVDDLWVERDRLKGIIRTLVPDYSDQKFSACLERVLKYYNSFNQKGD